MKLDEIIVFIAGVGGIAFTYWFFLAKKDKVVAVSDNVDITVDGGYSPEVISIPKDKKTTLHLTRKDPSNCLEEIVIPEFKIRRYLPLNKEVKIDITPKKSGTFEFACGMNMFHGKIIVTA